MEKILLDAVEVAELTGLSLARVYELSRRKLIPVIVCGERQYRYSIRAIESWIDNGGSRANEKSEVNYA